MAYAEFLRANGINNPGLLSDINYEEVLNQQQIFGEELSRFSNKDMQQEVRRHPFANINRSVDMFEIIAMFMSC